jgi:hypothetical protein
MEAREKILTIAEVPWCDDAARLLAGALRGEPCFTIEDLRQAVESDPDTRLYRGVDEAGELVGFVVLRVQRFAGGAEGVLLAAGGRLAGARLYGQVLPALERMFQGVVSLCAMPCRPGALRALLRAGYLPTHVTMRKAARVELPFAASRPRGDDLLSALALAGADERGGPSIQARPGRLHMALPGKTTTKVATTTNAQTTQNIDRRLVVDNGGIGFSSDGGQYTINVLDEGIVGRALDLVTASDQETGRSVADVLGFAQGVFDSGLAVLDKAGKQVETQSALVAKAYDQARGEGTQKNLVAAAAIATVAIVAVKVWGKA